MKTITSDEFTNEVLQSQLPVLVDFFTEHCIPCRTVAPMIEEIESESRATLKVVKIDAAAEAQLTASFSVNTVPTFILFRGGERITQFSGATSKRDIQRWLADSLR